MKILNTFQMIWIPLVVSVFFAPMATAQIAAINGYCNMGGTPSITSGLKSSNYLQGVIPNCTVTVYLTGTTTKATIYKDASSTPLDNPFKAITISPTQTGQWLFYAAESQGYDVVMSGGIPPNTFPSPVSLTDLFPGGGSGVGGVTQIIAGANIAISPLGGSGVVTINATQSFSPHYITASSLGCPQDSDLMLGGGTLSDTCFNAALAAATPQNPITIVQDGISLASNIHGPANGSWSIIGLGGGLSTIPISSCTITSNVITFVTAINSLKAGQGLIVGGFGTGCAALNGVNNQGVLLVVNSSGLSSTGFTANFTTSNVTTESETASASWLTGTGFYQQSGAIGATISNGVIVCVDPLGVPPSRGANVTIQDLVLNANSQGNSSFCSGLDFANLNNIYINNVTIFNNSHFGTRFDNVGNVVVHATKVFPYAPGVVLTETTPAFSDGLHFDGPANDIQVDDFQYHGSDDGIALNAAEGYCGPISRVQIANYIAFNSADFFRAYNTSTTCGNGLIPLIDQVGLTNVHGDAYKAFGYLGNNVGTHTLTLNPAITNLTWTNSHIYSPFGFLVYDNLGEIHFDIDWETKGSTGGPEWLNFAENQIHVQTLDLGHSTQIWTSDLSSVTHGVVTNMDGSACNVIDTIQFNGYAIRSNPIGTYGHLAYLYDAQGACQSVNHIVVQGYDQTNILHIANVSGGGIGTIQNPNYLPQSLTNGLITSYFSQEGRGTVLTNTGLDFTNSATFNGTWGASAGFPALVATFNGTSQSAVASNATTTAFTGTSGFSGCTWFNVGTVSPVDQILFTNISSAGYEFEVYGGTGRLGFYLINTITTNGIHVYTNAGVVSAGSLHLGCVTYDGSQHAAGVVVTIDGVGQTLTVDYDTLTSSTASTNALTIGCQVGCSSGAFLGVIGNIHLWNRKLSISEMQTIYKSGVNAF